MTDKTKRDSPLVKSVLALDNYLTELERVGGKINSTDMSTDFDIEYVQKLLTRFAECGKGVSEEVTNLSTQLNEARARAEAVAQGVTAQSERLTQRRNEENEKLEQFRILGQKVRDLTSSLSDFRRPNGQGMTEDDRAKLAANIPAIEAQLAMLIEELQALRQSARDSRMRTLEKNAESLSQTLQAVRQKLRDLNPMPPGAGSNGNSEPS